MHGQPVESTLSLAVREWTLPRWLCNLPILSCLESILFLMAVHEGCRNFISQSQSCSPAEGFQSYFSASSLSPTEKLRHRRGCLPKITSLQCNSKENIVFSPQDWEDNSIGNLEYKTLDWNFSYSILHPVLFCFLWAVYLWHCSLPAFSNTGRRN